MTSSLLPQLRAVDLPAVLRFVAGAEMAPDRSWLQRCLEASLIHLPQVSPRDLPELLLNLTQLDARLFTARGSFGGGGGAGFTLPSVALANEDGTEQERSVEKRKEGRGSQATAAAVAHKAHRHLEALAAAWLRRYLQLCREKLPRFTAAGVARMMVAVARAAGRLDDRWLQVACGEQAPLGLLDAVGWVRVGIRHPFESGHMQVQAHATPGTCRSGHTEM